MGEFYFLDLNYILKNEKYTHFQIKITIKLRNIKGINFKSKIYTSL